MLDLEVITEIHAIHGLIGVPGVGKGDHLFLTMDMDIHKSHLMPQKHLGLVLNKESTVA